METVGYNNNPLTYNGKFISAFDDDFSDLIPDCIIKRRSGVSMRPALATKYSAGMETATPTDIHFANAFSSPYLYKKKVNFNTCTILPVTTGSASTELGSAVYYNYPPSGTDYIYFHLNSSGEYDLTNAGCNQYDLYPYTPGESEVVRLKFLGQSTGPSLNLSDFTAVRNFYMPNLTGNVELNSGGLHGIFQFTGTVEDGGTNNKTNVQMIYPSGVVKEIENFYAPLDDGGFDSWGVGWEAISSVKNLHFAGYTYQGAGMRHGFLPSIKYIDGLTASKMYEGISANGVTVRGNNIFDYNLTNSDIDGNCSGRLVMNKCTADGEFTATSGYYSTELPTIQESLLGARSNFRITYYRETVRSGTYPTIDPNVPAGTYGWNVASGFIDKTNHPLFKDCTAHNFTCVIQ